MIEIGMVGYYKPFEAKVKVTKITKDYGAPLGKYVHYTPLEGLWKDSPFVTGLHSFQKNFTPDKIYNSPLYKVLNK